MKLFSKLLRDIKQSAGQFLSFVLVIAVGSFFYTGLATLSNDLSAYTEAYFEEHNLSDLKVFYSKITQEEISELSQLEGIQKLEGRYTVDATEAFEGYITSLKIHSIPENNEINTMAMTEGRLPSSRNEIILDSRYADDHQYTIGDEITIRIDEEEFALTISGLGENVEHVKKSNTQDHKNFGIAYVAEEFIPEVAGRLFYNELLVDAEDGYDIDQLGKSIEAQSKELSYLGQESKERSYGYSLLQATLNNNGLMSKVIPLVLFLIEAIILSLAMSRMIESQRNQVGIMKALGVKNSRIMLHYMGYPVLVSIVGSVVGYVISALLFVPLIHASNSRSYSLPGIQFALSYDLILPPIIISSLFGVVACYLSGRNVFKERAAQAMRPKPPKSMKAILIERIPALWSRLPYNYKLILRNIFLNKRKVLASSIGVMVSTVLLITAFGTQSSLQQVATQFEKVYTYDLRVDYRSSEALEGHILPDDITSHYLLASFPIDLTKDQQSEKATLNVMEQDNDLMHFFDEKGSPLYLDDNGVIVPQSYADHFSITEGDTIQIIFTGPGLDNKAAQMKVLKISTQYSNPSFYVTPDYLASFGLTYQPTTLLVDTDSSTDLDRIRSHFEQDQNVVSITDREDIRKEARYILQQNSFPFITFIICAVFLSFGAIYTISSINIFERNRELATLKVLGYYKNKINQLIFFENIIITTVAVLVAFPICGYVYELVVQALSSTHQQIPDQLNIGIVLLSALVAFVLTIIANLLLRRKVSRIDMIESLKGLE